MTAPNDDLLARLVRLADAGPEIPAGGAARIKAAVRPQWLAVTRARAIRRRVYRAAGLAAAALVIIVLLAPLRRGTPTPAALVPFGRIEFARGAIESRPTGNDLVPGSLVTTGPSGRAAVALSGGASVRIDAGTRLQFLSARRIVLHAGAVYADTHGAPLEVRTRFGVARDIGTRFEVRTGDELIVRVREGSVSVETPSRSLRIEEGSELALGRDGAHRTRDLRPDAAEWRWIHDAALPFAVEGRTVASFLQWVSREGGLRVVYADARTREIAETTILHGSLGALRPEEAAEVIPASAGLEVRRAPSGELVVRANP